MNSVNHCENEPLRHLHLHYVSEPKHYNYFSVMKLGKHTLGKLQELDLTVYAVGTCGFYCGRDIKEL